MPSGSRRGNAHMAAAVSQQAQARIARARRTLTTIAGACNGSVDTCQGAHNSRTNNNGEKARRQLMTPTQTCVANYPPGDGNGDIDPDVHANSPSGANSLLK